MKAKIGIAAFVAGVVFSDEVRYASLVALGVTVLAVGQIKKAVQHRAAKQKG